MTEYNGSISNLLQGVSQQARMERRPEQLESQVNCISSVTKGLGNRPGTQVLTDGSLTDYPANAAYHEYDRGDTLERYSIVIKPSNSLAITGITQADPGVVTAAGHTFTSGDSVRISGVSGMTEVNGNDYTIANVTTDTFSIVDTTGFSAYTSGGVVDNASIKVVDLLTGLDRTVDLDGHGAYLASTDPAQDFRFHTIADTTFILNRDKIPAMQTPTAASSIWQSVVYAKRVSWGFKYEILANGTVIAACTTPATVTLGSTEQSKNITLKTSDVIDCLYTGATVGNATWTTGTAGGVAAWGTANSVTTDKFEDVIYMSHATSDKKIEVKDANHGNDMVTFGQTIDQYDNLPRMCYDGYKVKVGGIDKTVYNDYYVTFEAENGSGIGFGVWKETAGFGVDTEFDPETMPHILTRESDDSFLLQEIDWVERKAGDDDTNPKPSFVGTEISDIMTYQGRLVLVSEENVVASVTFDHYNMFAETVTQESDSDPIDTASSDNQVTNLHHGLVFNASLILFSDRAQFVHPSDTAFTTSTFGLSSKSRFKNVVDCAPVASATSIFFPYQSGEFTGIREMQVENITGNLLADDISAQVDHYIGGSTKQLVSSTDYDILIVRPGDDESKLFVFQWFNQEGKRKQAAWHEWDFTDDIRHIALIQDKLYIWKVMGTAVSVEYIDLADTDSTGIAFPVRLDNSITVLSTTDTGYWNVDVSDLTDTRGIDPDDLIVVCGDNTGIEGALAEWSEHPTTDDTIRIPKAAVFPVSTAPYFIIGTAIDAEGEITNPYVRDNQGKPKTKGRLRLGSMKFNCSNTGALQIEVTKENSPTYTKEFNARLIDSSTFVLDEPPELIDVELKVAIRSDANRCRIKFKSSSHLPFYISNIDWTGSYYETGRRTI